MKIIIPVSSTDIHLLEPQLRLHEHLDGLRGSEVILSPSVNVSGKLMASGYIERLQAITRRTSVISPDYNEAGSWPAGPNRHWAKTAMALDREQNGEYWFWMELDCWPVVHNWALRLHEEYLAGKKAFMGCIVNTPFEDKIVRDNDLMMMGCAVYRHMLSENWEFRPILESMQNGVAVTVASQDKEQPWDIFARGAFRKWGWHSTDLIGDRWNTHNFRIMGGGLECDEGPSRFNNIAHKSGPLTSAVVIHGCKDDSLARLVMSGEYSAWLSKSKDAVATSPIPAPRQPMTSKEALEQLMGRPVAPVEHERFLIAINFLISEDLIQAEPVQPTESPDVLPKIATMLEHKNMRIKDLADKVGMTPKALTKLLEANGYDVMPKLGWVKKRA